MKNNGSLKEIGIGKEFYFMSNVILKLSLYLHSCQELSYLHGC